MALQTLAHTTTLAPPTVSNVLVLGGYPFGEYEHPPTLRFGVTQHSVELESIGGTISPQDLGPVHNETSWSGYFRGSDAADRALTYKRMAYKGGEYLLKWLRERYMVKVASFEYDYLTPNFLSYTCNVKVISDVAGQLKKANTPNVDQQTTALANTANNAASSIASVDGGTTAMGLLQQTQAATASLAAATPIAATAGSASTTAIVASVTTALTTAQTYAGSLVPGAWSSAHVLNANTLVNSLTLINANLTTGQPLQATEVFGGTFSSLAATRYGDPTLWQALANYNGFSSNVLPKGVKTTVHYPPLTGSTIS